MSPGSGGGRLWYPSGPRTDDTPSSIGGVSPSRPHNCGSPGCTKRGQRESIPPKHWVDQPHYCGSPGCSRKGEMETVLVEKSIPTPAMVRPAKSAPYEPNPYNFRITKVIQSDKYCLAEVVYSDCSNYEGRKILLVEMTEQKLRSMKILDPHFLKEKANGLLARFEPTDRGWKLGLSVLYGLQS